MQLSTRGRYAVMAMVDLATQQAIGCECGPVCLAEIAARQQLSLSYLEQLFGKLRRAGLVASARGPGGGYRLARTSDCITIANIVAAVDEPLHATRCPDGAGGCMTEPAPGSESRRCQTHELWSELSRQIGLFLAGVTLADVVAGRVTGRASRPVLPDTAAADPAGTASADMDPAGLGSAGAAVPAMAAAGTDGAETVGRAAALAAD